MRMIETLDLDLFQISVEVEPGHEDPIRLTFSSYPVCAEVAMDYDDLRELSEFIQRMVGKIDSPDGEVVE